MGDVSAMLQAYRRQAIPEGRVREFVHVMHFTPHLLTDIAKRMGIPGKQVTEEGKGIRQTDRYRITLTCTHEQHIWLKYIVYQRLMIE